MSIRTALSLSCVLAVVAASPLGAADKPEDLQAAITAVTDQFSKGFEARDAKAIAALFTEEGEFVDGSGTVFHGRSAIEAEFQAALEVGKPGTLSIDPVSIRPIATGIVVEDGVTTFQPKEEGAASQTRFTSTYVRQADGKWLLASVRETEPAEMTPHERLKTLAWLLGHWRQESAGSIVDTNWTWSKDGNFLLGDFETSGVESPLHGTHRIGWDAEREQFRSWVFNADGSAADGWWSRSIDDVWTVQLHGLSVDGDRIGARVAYERDGADALVITLGDQQMDGVGIPDETSRVVRQPPAPGGKTTGR
jgi:uncharacterized protein (TIGR02246 family)